MSKRDYNSNLGDSEMGYKSCTIVRKCVSASVNKQDMLGKVSIEHYSGGARASVSEVIEMYSHDSGCTWEVCAIFAGTHVNILHAKGAVIAEETFADKEIRRGNRVAMAAWTWLQDQKRVEFLPWVCDPDDRRFDAQRAAKQEERNDLLAALESCMMDASIKAQESEGG